MIEELWHIVAVSSALVLIAVVISARGRIRGYDFCANCRKQHGARPQFMNAFDFWDIYCRPGTEG